MNYTEQIFEILKIKPREKFKLKSTNNNKSYDFIYYLSDQLSLHCITNSGNDFKSAVPIEDILNGNLQIVKIPKIPKISEEEETAIKYFLLAGYKYMAQDKEGQVYAYKIKPIKSGIFWCCLNERLSFCKVEIPISFLSWEDSEPFHMGE